MPIVWAEIMTVGARIAPRHLPRLSTPQPTEGSPAAVVGSPPELELRLHHRLRQAVKCSRFVGVGDIRLAQEFGNAAEERSPARNKPL